MKIKFAFISKTGRRSNNEDYVKVIDKSDESRWLGVVCDGMGGHAMGEVASETVCNAICDYWERFTDEDLVERYTKQLHLYAQAFSNNYDVPIKNCLIYSFWLKKVIKVPVL